MAIMHSCCCWQSVRKGSYACAIYTMIYFALLALTTGTILWEEESYSFLESKNDNFTATMSPTTVQFNGMLLICSCCGVLCSLLLLYGLYKLDERQWAARLVVCVNAQPPRRAAGLQYLPSDRRNMIPDDHKMLLIPWVISVITCGIIDIAHCLYQFIVIHDVGPSKVMLYTLNFFLLSLNIYSLLCVISQYQEYSAGRGTAAHDYEYRFNPLKVPVVKYVTQPTTTTATTSCLSSRRMTSNETKATPTQSPTTCHNPLLSEKSPTGSRVLRKHVQFPDTSVSLNQIDRPEMNVSETPETAENATKRSPKIECNVRTWLQPSDAITIVINQSSPSNDEENNHCS